MLSHTQTFNIKPPRAFKLQIDTRVSTTRSFVSVHKATTPILNHGQRFEAAQRAVHPSGCTKLPSLTLPWSRWITGGLPLQKSFHGQIRLASSYRHSSNPPDTDPGTA